jgi:hypothetical protein
MHGCWRVFPKAFSPNMYVLSFDASAGAQMNYKIKMHKNG